MEDQRRLHPKQRHKLKFEPRAPHRKDRQRQEHATSVGELDILPQTAMPRSQQHPPLRRPSVTTAVGWGTTLWTADRRSSKKVERAKIAKGPLVQKKERTVKAKRVVKPEKKVRTGERVRMVKEKRLRNAVLKVGAKER